MVSFNVWERRIKEKEEKIRDCRTKIKYLENLGVKRELTDGERLSLMNLRLVLDRSIAELRQVMKSANSDYNLEALARSCPVPIDEEYYKRKLDVDGYIVCIKF